MYFHMNIGSTATLAKWFIRRLYPLQAFKLLARAQHPRQTLPMSKCDPVKGARDVELLLKSLHDIEHDPLRGLQYRFGFSVHKQKSGIDGAGMGVFLKGHCKAGQIVGFYPGTVYLPSEPMLFVSIANEYILKCFDGQFVDAKASGLSKRVYISLFKRENWPGTIQTSDMTWVTGKPRNPLAIGQIVNNGCRTHPPNVRYQEIDLPPTFPMTLRQYIPNIYWSPTYASLAHTRIVALVAMRDLQDEELFSKYMDLV